MDGDFLAQVQVSGEFHPSPPSTAPPNSPFVGAGLVLMDGDRTYARLEVDSVAGGDKIRRYANWELRLDGKNAFGIAQPSPEDRPTGLRLERQGDRLLASFSQDGASWTKLKPLDVKLRPKLKLGVSLITTSSGPSKAHFGRTSCSERRRSEGPGRSEGRQGQPAGGGRLRQRDQSTQGRA